MTKKDLFSRLLKKAVSMALWTKASLCVKSSLLEQSLPRTPGRPKTLCSLWLYSSCSSCLRGDKIREISVNPWLINDLRDYKALYNCRETFTDVMSPLQIRLFMQNEPNFRKSQMNVNKVLTSDYDKRTLGERGKKQSQTNPIKAKLKKAKMNVTSIITKGYENKPPIWAPKKQSQTSKRQKPMQTSLPKGIMKKTAILGPGKTKPNKPNSNPIKNQSPRPCYGTPPSTLSEDTLKKPGCISKKHCYIDDQWKPAAPPGFTNFNGWISISSFRREGLIDLPIQDKIITGEISWENYGCW
jgi:hypothetical protein